MNEQFHWLPVSEQVFEAINLAVMSSYRVLLCANLIDWKLTCVRSTGWWCGVGGGVARGHVADLSSFDQHFQSNIFSSTT